MGPQGIIEIPPLTTPAGIPTPYVNPGLLVYIVKAVMEGMVITKTHAALTAPALQTTLEVSATTDNTVLLVRLVKSMREMGCEPYMGEYDAEIARRWIKKVEKTMV